MFLVKKPRRTGSPPPAIAAIVLGDSDLEDLGDQPGDVDDATEETSSEYFDEDELEAVHMKVLEDKVSKRLNKRGLYGWLIDLYGGNKKQSAAATTVKRVG